MPFDGSSFLTAAQARVLGALMEKEATTPDYYPLSLNALVNACNQRSNREPVMELSEDEARESLHGLEAVGLAGAARGADGRVVKFEHRIGEAFNLSRAESALLCVLLLRGPQTPGELRGRCERMYAFTEIGDVLAGLQKLMERAPALAAVLPRQPGTKESRYAQLLTGPAETVSDTREGMGTSSSRNEADGRIAQLEAEVAGLRQEVAELRARIESVLS